MGSREGEREWREEWEGVRERERGEEGWEGEEG